MSHYTFMGWLFMFLNHSEAGLHTGIILFLSVYFLLCGGTLPGYEIEMLVLLHFRSITNCFLPSGY